MDKYPINLGKKMSGGQMVKPMEPGDKYFPSLHLSGDESLNLPESGLLTVRFKRVSESTSERDGEKYYDCTLDIKEIVSVKPDKQAEADEDTGDVLDRLKDEVESGSGAGDEDY